MFYSQDCFVHIVLGKEPFFPAVHFKLLKIQLQTVHVWTLT